MVPVEVIVDLLRPPEQLVQGARHGVVQLGKGNSFWSVFPPSDLGPKKTIWDHIGHIGLIF